MKMKKPNGVSSLAGKNSDLSTEDHRYVFPRGSIKDMKERLKAKLKEYENRKPRKVGPIPAR